LTDYEIRELVKKTDDATGAVALAIFFLARHIESQITGIGERITVLEQSK
jgi:hypothetical protein